MKRDPILLNDQAVEAAYRRGFADGFIRALDTLRRLVTERGAKLDAAYAAARRHWTGELRTWQTADHRGRCESPPALEGDDLP